MLTSKDWRGIWLISGVAVALVSLLVVKAVVGSGPKRGADNCIGVPATASVLLIDRSEEITSQTLDEIASRAFDHIRRRTQPNERVTVFSVTDLSKHSLTPIVSLCRPPDSGNRLTENPELIRRTYLQRFEEPIRLALSAVPGHSPESPLAQAITDVSLSTYLRGDANALLIFSDMLENTPAFSLYRCPSASTVIAQYRESRRGAKERPTFRNTKVYLSLIPRLHQSAETLKCRDTLWTWFFGDNAGASAGLELDYLPGGDPSNVTRKIEK